MARSQSQANGPKLLAPQGVEAGDREPAELYAEEIHQQQRQPEGRDGETEEDEHGDALVQHGIPAGCRQYADRDGQAELQDQGDDIEGEGDRDPLLDLVHHRPVVRGERTAEIEAGQPPTQVTYWTWSGLSRP